MIQLIKNIFYGLHRFAYPSFCVDCENLIAQEEVFCFACSSKLPPVASITLPISKKRTMTVLALAPYQGVLRTLILQKNSGRWRNFKALAQLTATQLTIKNLNPDSIIPIPQHWTRTLWRGFNQSAILAQEYAGIWQAPLFEGLVRTKKTTFQSNLDKNARSLNVKKAFEIKESYAKLAQENITNKHVVLVDDVMTTGATLIEAAQIIQQYQPAKITALVVCRVT